MGDIRRRVTRLECPAGDRTKLMAEHMGFLRECCRIRARVDATYAMPDEAALRAEAERLAATGKTPAQVAMEALVHAWEEAQP
jgi:hypothetical protein